MDVNEPGLVPGVRSVWPAPRHVKIAFVVAAAVILIAGVGLYYGSAVAWRRATEPATDPAQYETVLAQWDPALVEHFPPSIPADAKDAWFFAQPRGPESRAILQLSCVLPSETVEAVETDALAKARWSGPDSGTGFVKDQGDTEDLAITKFWDQGLQSFQCLPADYTVVVLEAEPGKSEPRDWTHGQSRGVAISRRRNQVIYWVEQW